MKCKLNQSLIVAVVFILTATCHAKANPLIEAASSGNTEKVQTLLAQGANVNAKDYNGGTALMAAAFSGHTDTVQFLLAKGADIEAKEINGATALMFAALEGHTDTVKALLAKGADVNDKEKRGATVLMWASGKGRSDTVQVLLAKGADVNAKLNDEQTALMYAARYGHIDIVQALLAHGADVNAKTKLGDTALMQAKKEGHEEIVRMLKEAGAEPYLAKDNEELCGTWENPNYSRQKGWNTMQTQKLVFRANRTFERFAWVDRDDSEWSGSYKIKSKWTDSEGNVWYKIHWKYFYRLEHYGLFKISYSGKKCEFVTDSIEYGYPKKIDPRAYEYRVYYRK